MNLLFATANLHKVEEAQHILGKEFTLLTPAHFGYIEDIPEKGKTLEDNALQKARTIWNVLGKDCFADDTGLEVFALNGAPGVYSARYANHRSGLQANHAVDMYANIEKLLKELAPHPNRNAQFRCVIALILDGSEYLFEGTVQGCILAEKEGAHGFGYDPLFLPHGYTQTFATMPPHQKNTISHRALALQQLKNFLDPQSPQLPVLNSQLPTINH